MLYNAIHNAPSSSVTFFSFYSDIFSFYNLILQPMCVSLLFCNNHAVQAVQVFENLRAELVSAVEAVSDKFTPDFAQQVSSLLPPPPTHK